MAGRYLRIVQLWVKAGQEQPFEAFEREAARIMARHGGRIDQAVRLDAGPDTPYEIHVVSFPDEAAFNAYRADPATMGLQQKRDSIIARTVAFAGAAAGPTCEGKGA